MKEFRAECFINQCCNLLFFAVQCLQISTTNQAVPFCKFAVSQLCTFMKESSEICHIYIRIGILRGCQLLYILEIEAQSAVKIVVDSRCREFVIAFATVIIAKVFLQFTHRFGRLLYTNIIACPWL